MRRERAEKVEVSLLFTGQVFQVFFGDSILTFPGMTMTALLMSAGSYLAVM